MIKEVEVTEENLSDIRQIDSVIITYTGKDSHLYRMNVESIDGITIDNYSDTIYRFKNSILALSNIATIAKTKKEQNWYITAMADYQLALKHNLSFSQVTGLLLKDEHLDEWNELVDKLCKEYNVERIK